MGGGGGGGGGGLAYCVPVHYSFAKSLLSALYCHSYSKFGSWRGGGVISPLAPVTTALHKRGGHIIHNGCVPIDVEVLGG